MVDNGEDTAGLGDPILRWARDHLVWSAVALGLILFTVKLLFVARGNISVALALLQVANPKSVFLGTLIANLPLVATVLFILSGAWLGMAIVSDGDPGLVAIMAGPLLIISVLMMPAPVFGSVQQDTFSGALLAFGVSYVLTQLLPIIAKWFYDTPEFVILTKGIEVYAPGSLMSLKNSARPLLAQLEAQGVSLPSRESKAAGQVFEELVDEYDTTVKALVLRANGVSTTLSGMGGDRIAGLRAEAEELSGQRRKTVIGKTDAFITGLDYDRDQVRRELQDKNVNNSDEYVAKLQELRDRAGQARFELASSRPVVREAERFKVIQTSRLIAGLAFAIVVLFTIANSEMWLPASQITLRSSPAQVRPSVPGKFAGYVLAYNGGWTTIMLDADRSIVRVLTSSVASQPICSPRGSVLDNSIYEVIFEGAAAVRKASPRCPVS